MYNFGEIPMATQQYLLALIGENSQNTLYLHYVNTGPGGDDGYGLGDKKNLLTKFDSKEEAEDLKTKLQENSSNIIFAYGSGPFYSGEKTPEAIEKAKQLQVIPA